MQVTIQCNQPFLWDNPEKQLTLGARKKVTFDSSVTTYEHVSVEESVEFSAENEDGSKREEEEENFAKSSQSQSHSEDESRSKVSLPKGTPPPFTEEIESPAVVSGLPERELKPNPNVRDRSAYVHSVLNPVENLTQWKAVKAKGTTIEAAEREFHSGSRTQNFV
ncbi:hypothetical protein GH714_026879 [Hevea brasiliensis]|uniref:Uncharacterized protein n=1 Tax=Hevea brasiliensis TaxID=3981 RepID=A0A6A6L3A1_HEVBR|nr:hypothetical protein GH714_026879 [Hevea brasiliensis]